MLRSLIGSVGVVGGVGLFNSLGLLSDGLGELVEGFLYIYLANS